MKLKPAFKKDGTTTAGNKGKQHSFTYFIYPNHRLVTVGSMQDV